MSKQRNKMWIPATDYCVFVLMHPLPMWLQTMFWLSLCGPRQCVQFGTAMWPRYTYDGKPVLAVMLEPLVRLLWKTLDIVLVFFLLCAISRSEDIDEFI